MRTRTLALTAAAGLAATALITSAPAAAAPTTLYAYANGTGHIAACPKATTPTSQCSLSAAIDGAADGDTVRLETPGATAHYIGNWGVAHDITLVGDAAGVTLDGNGGAAAGCQTTSCTGSILSTGGSTAVTIDGLTFTGAKSSAGGGAISVGLSKGAASLTVRHSRFTNNSTTGFGGAVTTGSSDPAIISISGSSFDHNSALQGGALYVGTSSPSALTVLGSVFDSNTAVAGQGEGGAIAYGGTTASTAAASSFTVRGSTFRRNVAANGGAIAAVVRVDLQVADSTFDANSASYGAAALEVFALGSGAVSSVTGSTFHGNLSTGTTSFRAPDIASDGATVLAGDLFTGGCVLETGSWVDDGYNAAVDKTCLNRGVGDVVSSAVGSKLAPLAPNRTSAIPTIALAAGNPAIGRIPAGATAPHAPAASRALCPRTDQTGLRSATGAACSAGAVELVAPTLTFTGDRSVARGSKHTLTGSTRPGATVALDLGTTKLAATTATKTGAFGITRTVTTGGMYTVLVDGLRSSPVSLSVVTLTLTPAPTPLRKGVHTLSGHAPAGRSVTLLRDGHVIAHTTATGKNAYAFRLNLTATHRYQVGCDGVTTRPTTIRVAG